MFDIFPKTSHIEKFQCECRSFRGDLEIDYLVTNRVDCNNYKGIRLTANYMTADNISVEKTCDVKQLYVHDGKIKCGSLKTRSIECSEIEVGELEYTGCGDVKIEKIEAKSIFVTYASFNQPCVISNTIVATQIVGGSVYADKITVKRARVDRLTAKNLIADEVKAYELNVKNDN